MKKMLIILLMFLMVITPVFALSENFTLTFTGGTTYINKTYATENQSITDNIFGLIGISIIVLGVAVGIYEFYKKVV